MTIPTWPAELPQYIRVEGFSLGVKDTRLSSKPSVGPPKVRRRSSSAVKPFTGGFMLTSDQWRRLEEFWDSDTKGGSLPFLMRDTLSNSVALQTESGEGIQTELGVAITFASWWLVLFSSPPTLGAVTGELFQVDLSLSIMP